MAASIMEVGVQPKRKLNELEDITNNGFSNSKKLKMSFRKLYFNSDNGKGKKRKDLKEMPAEDSKEYQDSPLLTPKDEEDDVGVEYYEGADAKGNSETEKEEINEKKGKKEQEDLNTNPDYIALTSSLRLLNENRNQVRQDIVHLSHLLDYYTQVASDDEVVRFFLALLDNKLNLPKQNRTLKSPIVDWSKYHNGLTNVNRESFDNNGDVNDKPFFKTLNLFDSK